MDKLRSSIIIPTYHRPKELDDCVKSILEQTVLPDEVLVVDDGNLDSIPYEKECKEKGINYVYLKKETPGLTASRNLGIEKSTGDIIIFLDDDVILSDIFVEEILKVYKDDVGKKIGGVSGLITNVPKVTLKGRMKVFVESLFLVSSFKEGQVLPSGFCVDYGKTGIKMKKVKKVDFLPGGLTSYRREVFDEFSFDSKRYLKYGMGEDKDFSYPVSKKYNLYVNPKATLLHLEAPNMRPDKVREGKMFITFLFTFFTRHVKKGWWSWIIFIYAILGYLFMRTTAFSMSPGKHKSDYLKGFLQGTRDILKEHKDVKIDS